MQSLGRMVWSLAGAAALAALAGGCASIREHRGYVVDNALVDSVLPGVDNQLSVEKSLGRPTFVSEFGEPAWYYVSRDTRQRPLSSARPYQQSVLRVRFDQVGNVVAVDRRGLEKVAHIDPDGDKTPTLGRDRSFLEDLFGNIGAVGAPGMGGGEGGPGGPNGS